MGAKRLVVEPLVETHVHNEHGPAIHNIECSSYITGGIVDAAGASPMTSCTRVSFKEIMAC